MLEGVDQSPQDDTGPSLPAIAYEGSVTATKGAVTSGLTQQQREFARLYVIHGGNATKAAELAGYQGARKAGWRNLLRPLVLHEIKRLSIVHTEAWLPLAIRQLVEIMCDPTLDPKARVMAANSLLDRGGMRAKSDGPAVQVNVQINGQAAQAAIAEVWDTRNKRLAARPSGISASMPDTAARELADAERAGAQAAAAWEGGDHPQGPVAGPVIIPSHCPEHDPEQPEGEE